ncbi:MAG: class I SAM-dependent methyltransferase [Planctomycetota bacterium]
MPSTKRQQPVEVATPVDGPIPVRIVGGPVVIPARRASEAGAAAPPKKKTKDGKEKRKKRKAKRTFTAKTADVHELYQLSVQSPEEDVKFLKRVYKRLRKRDPKHFREDFCGTGLLMTQWIDAVKDGTAEGFDICPDTLGWGVRNNFARLGEAASRATLHVKDVREPSLTPPDVRCAQNFSYFIFKQRAELVGYLKSVHADLADGGVFVMDIYGGPESMEEMLEERDIEEGFTYIWDQHKYWPATGDYKTHIHFHFKDGTKLERAFTYDWRLWTLPELKDALHEAGFENVESFWEGTDEDGESGNGIYRPSKKGENCLAWVTYLVAAK